MIWLSEFGSLAVLAVMGILSVGEYPFPKKVVSWAAQSLYVEFEEEVSFEDLHDQPLVEVWEDCPFKIIKVEVELLEQLPEGARILSKEQLHDPSVLALFEFCVKALECDDPSLDERAGQA